MFNTEEKEWGSHYIIGRGEDYKVKRLTFHPQKATSIQFHHYRNELMQCVDGTAEVVITERGDSGYFEPTTHVLNVGDYIYIPKHTIHQIRNKTDVEMVIIEIQTGQDDMLEEFDICRLDPRGILNYPD